MILYNYFQSPKGKCFFLGFTSLPSGISKTSSETVELGRICISQDTIDTPGLGSSKVLVGSASRALKEIEFGEGEGIEYFDEETMPITTNHYLYLSGTPFRAIASGEFIEEQIFNWTYSDEQKAKSAWVGQNNPYASLPRMVLMTYQLPDSIKEIAMKGEFNEFDLNIFFSATGDGANAEFKYKDEVQKWLELIRGGFSETSIDNLKMG